MINQHKIKDSSGRYSANYLFAGIPVRIITMFQQFHLMSADYYTEMEPELFIETSLDEIKNERFDDKEEGDMSKFRDNYIETLLVYRKLALLFLDHGILLMHGSCLAVDGKGVLFTALSGTGKSTHTRLWRELLGDKVIMVNDDKPLVAVKKDTSPIIYGTPWNGKHHLSTNIGVPLKAIVHLQRGTENHIQPLKANEIFHILIQQTFRTNDPIVTMKVLGLLENLAKNVQFYDLHCNMDIEAAQVAYKGIF